MRTLRLALFFFWVGLLAGCSKSGNEVTPTPSTPTPTTPAPPELNINYPAAYVVNAESNNLSVIDLATLTVKETISFGSASNSPTTSLPMNQSIVWPHHVYLSPDGSKLGVGVPGVDMSAATTTIPTGAKGRVLVVNPKTGIVVSNQQTPVINQNAVFSPDGTEIWTSQPTDNKVLVYDAATMSIKKSIDVGQEPAEVTISTNAGGTVPMYAFVANHKDNTVTAIKLADKSVAKTIPVGQGPVRAWPGANNRMYVNNLKSGSISVIDVNTLNVVENIGLSFTPAYVAHHATRNEIWVAQAGTSTIAILEWMGLWMYHAQATAGKDATSIAFDKDLKMAYITNREAGTVSVIDVATRVQTKEITVGKKPSGLVLKQ
jgi:YVTN family beta-propeller protein